MSKSGVHEGMAQALLLCLWNKCACMGIEEIVKIPRNSLFLGMTHKSFVTT